VPAPAVCARFVLQGNYWLLLDWYLRRILRKKPDHPRARRTKSNPMGEVCAISNLVRSDGRDPEADEPPSSMCRIQLRAILQQTVAKKKTKSWLQPPSYVETSFRNRQSAPSRQFSQGFRLHLPASRRRKRVKRICLAGSYVTPAVDGPRKSLN